MIDINKKIYLDFDGCITNSIKKICEMYNEDYRDCNIFKPAKWYLVNTWSFEDQCPLASRDEIDDYFNQKRFFDNKLEFMENAEEVINKLSEHFDIYVVSMGNEKNLTYKEGWLENNLPYIKGFIGCNFDEVSDKSHIDMSGEIFIDDSANNLETSNSELKILYGDIYSWNKNYKGIRKFNWYEVYEFLVN